MSSSKRSGSVRAAAWAVVAGVTGAGAHGATFTWDGNAGTDNNWNTANNWTANSGSPGAADTASWSGSSTPSPATVDLSQNEAAANLNVNNKDVTFNLNNFALTVGSTTTTVDGNAGDVTFNGPGTASIGGLLRIGFDAAEPALHTRVSAAGGATVTTSAGMTLGDYRGGGIVAIDGAGTTWNSSGPVQFGRAASGSRTFTQPRTQLLITNGGVFNHDTGNTTANTFVVSRANRTDSRIVVDGAGSQLNFIGGYGSNVRIGGYQSATNWEITNGGVLTSTEPLGLSFRNETTNPKVNTFTISGAGSKMSAPLIALAGRSSSDMARGATVVNVLPGGTLEGTDFDGFDYAIAVGDRGLLSLQGGTVNITTAGKAVGLRNGGVAGEKSTIEGFGTIQGGNLVAETDTRIRPGINGAGTIDITGGNLTTAGGATPTDLLWELQTTAGNPHDLVAASGAGSVVTIGNNSTDDITFSVLDGGSLAAGAEGFMDFLIGETVNYGNTPLLDDVPDIDNLDDLLAAAGYTRVDAAVVPGPGEYRYYKALVSPLDYGGDYSGLQAIRLDFAPIPEPASLGLLGLGALPLLLRRRRR